MFNKKFNKKGFTIVELVVVIAIVAILAAILIPMFVNITKKAKTSADVQLVTNINKALAVDEALNGASPTLYNALEAVEENGYKVEKLTPTNDGNLILWDQTTNRFVLLDAESSEILAGDGATVKGVNLWNIAHDENEVSDTYSNYYDYDVTTIETSTGVDVGKNTNVESITYENTSETVQNIIIRTNSNLTTINIDGENSNITHYGEANAVNIIRVAKESYHEKGKIEGDISLAYGKVEIEENAYVNNIVIKALTDKHDTTVTPVQNDIILNVVKSATVNSVSSLIDSVSVSNVLSGDGANEITKIDANSAYEAYIGNTGYATLADAFGAAPKNAVTTTTITLGKDVVADSFYTIINGKKIILNLNGHEIQSTVKDTFRIAGAYFHVIGTGSIFENVINGDAPLLVKGSTTDVANFTVVTIDKDVTLKGDYAGIMINKDESSKYKNYGLVVNMNGTIDLSTIGETGIDVYGNGIYINGSNQVTSGNVMQINLNGARIIGADTSIYGAGYAKWTIEGNCRFDSGMEFKAGIVDIYGGTFNYYGEESHEPNQNGTSTTGYSLAVVGNSYYCDILNVTIYDGTFNGGVALFADNTITTKAILTVKGGTFQEGKLYGLINDGFADNINVFNKEI